MNPAIRVLQVVLVLSIFISVSLGQEVNIKKENNTVEKSGAIKDINSPQAGGDKIIFRDGTTPLLDIENLDEAGALILYDATVTGGGTGKYLQNNGGNLLWGGQQLGLASGGVSAIGDLSDAFTNASSIYLGVNTLPNLTTGVNNNALGIDALKLNTSGSSNNAIGINALGLNTEGGGNEAIGNSALYRNTTGSGNIGIGNSANYYNQTGSNNTIIGYRAGFGAQLHNKSGNVFLGYNAGYNEEGSNKLYIENSNSVTPLIYGDFTNNSEMVKINGDLYSEGKAYGGNFSASNNGGVAVYAVATDANNNLFQGNTGGRFEAKAGEGIGVSGVASNFGVLTNYGGIFTANGEAGIGVQGYAGTNNGSNTNYGGKFEAKGANGYGVHATAPTTGYAGYFEGNVNVTGNLGISGELNRSTKTGSANLLPIAYGNIAADGTTNSGTGNFTVTWNSALLGYDISIANENYNNNDYIVILTSHDANRIISLGNHPGATSIRVYSRDYNTNIYGQGKFSFIVHKP